MSNHVHATIGDLEVNRDGGSSSPEADIISLNHPAWEGMSLLLEPDGTLVVVSNDLDADPVVRLSHHIAGGTTLRFLRPGRCTLCSNWIHPDHPEDHDDSCPEWEAAAPPEPFHIGCRVRHAIDSYRIGEIVDARYHVQWDSGVEAPYAASMLERE